MVAIIYSPTVVLYCKVSIIGIKAFLYVIYKDIFKVMNKKIIVFQMLCYNQTVFNSLFSKVCPVSYLELE